MGDLQIDGNANMTLCKMDKVKGIRGSVVMPRFLWRPCKAFKTIKDWMLSWMPLIGEYKIKQLFCMQYLKWTNGQ